MQRNISILLIAFTFLTLSSYCQTTTQSAYWLRYQNQMHLSPHVLWNTEIDNRRFISPDAQLQLIIHSRLHRKSGPFDFGGGMTLSWAYAQRPNNAISHPTFEIRPVLEASYERPKEKLSIQHRLRLDNRFIEEYRLDGLDQDYDYTARLRYRIQAKIPIIKKEKAGSISARVANEAMVNHRKTFFDQNRIYTTLDFTISRALSIEGGYIYIHQRRFGRDEYFNRHVLRFSVLHRMQLHH